MGFYDKPPRAGEVKKFRERLLAPNSTQVETLGEKVGDKFHAAILACIEGEKAFGIEEDDALDIQTDKVPTTKDLHDTAERTEMEKKKLAESEEKMRKAIELNVKLQRSFMTEVVDNLGTMVL